MPPLDAKKLLVISPHLDDAVLSCGALLAQVPGATVATVFAGIPRQADRLTAWDAASGFRDARHAMLSRREEDRQALALLGVTPLWLDFCDSQYHETASLGELSDAASALIGRTCPDTILFPAGLFHSDHALVHDAVLALLQRHAGAAWFLYEEPWYRRVPGLLQERLARLLGDGIQATPAAGPDGGKAAAKREAVHCYASQLRALERTAPHACADVWAPESYWRLALAAGAGKS